MEPLQEKQTISHFRIVKKIGSGGMGEVYLAEDTRLHRKVALKVLRLEFSNLKDRIDRFENEARAISAINHPNILTIYDVGQINSSSFIASEYIEGQTLRERIRTSRISFKEVLAIALQVAEALDAAHRAGIVHRDIKPENIMLRTDGYVKVLDFGVAKLLQREIDLDPSDLETIGRDTETGALVGTYKYMSPEQARGLKVDARSDIFSFGVLFQEMLVGRSPFEGATTNDVLVAILEKQPPPLRTYGNFPEELQWILTKALAKDREERYQSMKDLLIDLKRVKHQIDTEEENKYAGVSREAMETQAGVVPKTSKVPFILIMVVILLVAISISYLRIAQKREEVPEVKPPFAEPKHTRLTSSGKAWGAVVSPDGKYVVYVQEDAQGNQNLRLRQLSTDTDISIITPPEKTNFGGPRFSPDGEYLYYVALYPGQEKISLYQVPILGGVTKRLLDNINSSPAFSPDGKKIAFVREVENECLLMIANADGANQQKIGSQKYPFYYDDVEWSPHEKFLTAIIGDTRKRIVRVSLGDGSEHPLFDMQWKSDYSGDLQWIPDGSGIILVKEKDEKQQIYHVAYPSGTVTAITNDLNDYGTVSLANDGQSVVTTLRKFNASLWAGSSAKPENALQITYGTDLDDGHMGLSWTRDGRIVYSSQDPNGVYQLWSIHPDGTNRTRITSGKQHLWWPNVSPDGRYVVFNAEDDQGNLRVWLMDSDGGNQRLLSAKKKARFPRFSPDGKWILFSAAGDGKQELIKIDSEGTAETVLASHTILYGGGISPDGKRIAYPYADTASLGPTQDELKVNIINFDEGTKIMSIPLPDNALVYGRVHWAPDGNSLAIIAPEPRAMNIFLQPLDGSPLRRLTNSEEDIFNFAWSMDGKQIAFSRGALRSDIVLIRNTSETTSPKLKFILSMIFQERKISFQGCKNR